LRDLATYRLAVELWERRQRRWEAEGRPFEAIKPVYSPGAYLSVYETMRRCLKEHWQRRKEGVEVDPQPLSPS
jgi:hypothetical protein